MITLLSVVVGWLVGGLANWAADVLPRWRTDNTKRQSPISAWPHYWTLWWYLPRWGVCPHCDEHRSWRAPLLELTMILAFSFVGLEFGHSPGLLLVEWVYAAFLLTVLVIDFEERRVLNVMLIPSTVTALLLSFTPGMPGPVSALMGAGVGFALLFLIALAGRGTLGAGDIKLAGVIGLMTGYPVVIKALLLGVIFAGVAAGFLLFSRRANRRSTMAYAPYLVLGALCTLWGGLGG